MKVLVTGAAGQLGIVTVREFARDHEVVGLAMRDLDITDHRAVMARVASERPGVVINCAAFNDVDRAEDDPLVALRVNAFAVRSLARAAAQAGAVLVHYGTDFVFDGENRTLPYTEEDSPNPQSVYAASKLVGEWFAAGAPRHYVLRVESLFGATAEENFRGKSSIDRIIDTLAAGGEARAFADRVVSPSYVVDVARATRGLLERAAPPGLYHVVNSGQATWYEVASAIARLLKSPGRPVPVPVAGVALRAARPRFAALSNERLARAGIPMPSWEDALARYVRLRETDPTAV